MHRTQIKTVSIASSHDAPPLSKAQKSFNSLIKQIEKQRAMLEAWEHAIPPYQRKFTSELLPLTDILADLQEKVVYRLDTAWGQKGITKSERRLLSTLIADMALVLSQKRDDNEDLKAIYNKHSGSDYDRDEADDMKGMQSVLEGILGVELDVDMDKMSPEELMQHAQEQMAKIEAEDDAYWQAQEERRAKRKKSAKQLAREAQKEAEEQQVSQSIRDVYRKLASALHPDREPDVQERERKTLLMQRVNEAYAKNNLLKLLELQLELEHIDQSSINTISEDRLKHYNTILKEQLSELQQEIFHVEGDFRARFGIEMFARVSPKTILRDLAVEVVELKRANREIERDLKAFDEVRNIKVWLKGLKRHSARDEFFDCPF
jgi:hypothetical protein